MDRKTAAITGIVLFFAGLLLGFIPEYMKASSLAGELQSARQENKVSQIRESALLSYVDASKLNYGSAAEDSERMFGVAKQVVNETKDQDLRNSLNGLLTFQEGVRSKLSTADAGVMQPLEQIVQKTRTELKR